MCVTRTVFGVGRLGLQSDLTESSVGVGKSSPPNNKDDAEGHGPSLDGSHSSVV